MSDTLLPFNSPGEADASWLRAYTEQSLGSDCAAVNIILLREKYHTTVATHDGFLFRHYDQNPRLLGYAFPVGSGDVQKAILCLRQDAAARGRELRFCLLTAEQRDVLQSICPGEFRYMTDRGDADYLYRRTQLVDLPGTLYHGKRNHIAQFSRAYPEWYTRPLSRDTVQDALRVARAWQEAQEPSLALQHEARAIRQAMQCLELFRLFGLVLYADKQPVAMTVGSLISPFVADIHYEKCLPDFRRAYAVINREFARALPDSCTFINREEDLNFPGLRQAKLSYHPDLVLEKYFAIPLNP